MRAIYSFGATNGARTRDPQLGKLMLYQLSYCRINSLQKYIKFLYWQNVAFFKAV